jgi:hypothetical protein
MHQLGLESEVCSTATLAYLFIVQPPSSLNIDHRPTEISKNEGS